MDGQMAPLNVEQAPHEASAASSHQHTVGSSVEWSSGRSSPRASSSSSSQAAFEDDHERGAAEQPKSSPTTTRPTFTELGLTFDPELQAWVAKKDGFDVRKYLAWHKAALADREEKGVHSEQMLDLLRFFRVFLVENFCESLYKVFVRLAEEFASEGSYFGLEQLFDMQSDYLSKHYDEEIYNDLKDLSSKYMDYVGVTYGWKKLKWLRRKWENEGGLSPGDLAFQELDLSDRPLPLGGGGGNGWCSSGSGSSQGKRASRRTQQRLARQHVGAGQEPCALLVGSAPAAPSYMGAAARMAGMGGPAGGPAAEGGGGRGRRHSRDGRVRLGGPRQGEGGPTDASVFVVARPMAAAPRPGGGQPADSRQQQQHHGCGTPPPAPAGHKGVAANWKGVPKARPPRSGQAAWAGPGTAASVESGSPATCSSRLLSERCPVPWDEASPVFFAEDEMRDHPSSHGLPERLGELLGN